MAMEKKAKAATETGLYLALVAAIVIVANVLSFSLHRRVDTTKAERFTLSKGSGRLVANLKKPLTVKAYVSTGLAKLDAFVRDLDDLMREYEQAGQGKFVYQKVVAKSESEKAEAKEYGLKELMIGEGSETGADTATFSQGYMGLVFLYGDEKDVIPVMSPDNTQGLEFWISNKIREIRDKADDIQRKIGIVGGHDEIKISEPNLTAGGGRGAPTLRGVMEQAFPYYKFEDVDLKGGETEIDGSLDALLITQPGKDYSDKELRRVDQFLMKENKGLIVYASAVNIKASDPKFAATLATHNLEKLLSGYGVDMKKDAVLDFGRSLRFATQTQGAPVWIRQPAIVQAQTTLGADAKEQTLDTSFPGFFRIDELSFPFPSTLELHADKQPGAKLAVLARSSADAAGDETAGLELGLKRDWVSKGARQQRVLAVSVEGKVKSAFGGGDADGVKIDPESKGGTKILVVSSAQFLANPFARAGNGTQLEGQMGMMMPAIGGDPMLQQIAGPYAQKYLTGTILAFKNTLDWATGDSDLVAASAKIMGDPNLTYASIIKPKAAPGDDEAAMKKKDEEYRNERASVQKSVQYTLILLAPLAFAAFGFARWRMRDAARMTPKL